MLQYTSVDFKVKINSLSHYSLQEREYGRKKEIGRKQETARLKVNKKTQERKEKPNQHFFTKRIWLCLYIVVSGPYCVISKLIHDQSHQLALLTFNVGKCHS